MSLMKNLLFSYRFFSFILFVTVISYATIMAQDDGQDPSFSGAPSITNPSTPPGIARSPNQSQPNTLVPSTPGTPFPGANQPTTLTPGQPQSSPQAAGIGQPVTTTIPADPSRNPLNKTILINFNNVSIIEFIRFLSKVSNKNFIFDENDLQFNVTIVSEEPTTIQNTMTALLQELRIHDLTMIEQGNNIVIHRNPGVNAISKVVSENLPDSEKIGSAEIVTRLFRLNTADADKISAIIQPLVSEKSIIEVFKETNHIIITDIVTNIEQIANLIKALDAPNNGLVIGQFVVRGGFIDSLILLAQKIMQPISQDKILIFVPHRTADSIFIVSTPFLMERTMAILQYLDQNQGITRIFDLKDLKFLPGEGGPPTTRPGQWELDGQGNWVFRPLQQPGVPSGNQPPQGTWSVDEQGNWHFKAGQAPPTPRGRGIVGPDGQWVLDSQGIWVFQLAPGTSISPERVLRPSRATADLPVGHIERTQFFIYKLRYRKGEQVQSALGKIGQGLRVSGTNNQDLVEAIDSVQWIEASNSLIFTGTVESLDKIAELVREVDAPLRQVFIEMLILETDMTDSLEFSVNWGTRFGGGNFSGSQAFLTPGSPLAAALDTATLTTVPDASSLARAPGFSQGIVGRTITHGGVEFTSLGALIRAVHEDIDINIVMSPKILTEDNSPAEIFVGINTRFPTQSIVNDQGVIVTQNFEFRDVGTRLRVTPLIGANDVITLIIEEEVSRVITSDTNVGESGPTTSRNNTTTRVHLPNEFFLVISGMMQDEDTLTKRNVPCLGGIPFIGAAFSQRIHSDSKRNLMIFIRPKIIDTEEEIQDITRHEQDIYKYKKRIKKSWKYETGEAWEFFNLPDPEGCCDEDCECGDSYPSCCK